MVSKSKIENMLTEAYNHNEEAWREVFFDKASVVEFAQKIIKGEK